MNDKQKQFKVTDVQIYVYGIHEKDASFGVNFAINNNFMIQYDAEKCQWSVPTGEEACWNDEDMQSEASGVINAEDLALELDLPTTITAICEQYVPDWYGEDAQIERLKQQQKI